MKLKIIIVIQFAFLLCTSINGQTFLDSPGNEKDGDFPSKWELIKGSAQIGAFKGSKVILIANNGIINPKINSKNYLSESFTLKFDAYFDVVRKSVNYQYYQIRFWDGNGNVIVPSANGDGFYGPIQIYRHRAMVSGRAGSSEKIFDDVTDKTLEGKDGVWRSITINYNKGTLKIFIDKTQILNKPNFNLMPAMISIGAIANEFEVNFVRAIKNVRISGVTSIASNTGGTDNNNLPTGNDSIKINALLDDKADADTNTALIYGDFDKNIFRINGQFQIGNRANGGYAFPKVDGSSKQILQTDGNGNLNWTDPAKSQAGDAPTTQNDTTTKSDGIYTGLEAIDEGNGIGWRLKGRDPIVYGNIGKDAVDLSFPEELGRNDYGATGNFSFATGQNTIASGTASTAMGTNSIASGIISTAMGLSTKAEGENSTAMGNATTASGINSFTVGFNSIASGANSFATGVYTRVEGDQSFAAGANTIASGNSSTSLGEGARASGNRSMAGGLLTKASGDASMAMGRETTASGVYSTAMGKSTTASGEASFAAGENTIASGTVSFADGYHTIASGKNSTTMGYYTKAESYNSTAIGSFNIGGGDPTSWRATDPLFEIGNGNIPLRNNAFTILKNGNIGIGTHKPVVKLQITEGTDASLTAGGYMIIGDRTGENIVFDNNEIMARKNVQPSTLFLQHQGGDVFVGGALVHSSDIRLKKDIENLSYGLNEVLQLRPVLYLWKSDTSTTKKSIGLIAQEVEPVIKELISVNTKNENMLGINYTELIPVLIKAIQEQQVLIESLRKRLEKIEAK